jgi:hypothetical protein
VRDLEGAALNILKEFGAVSAEIGGHSHYHFIEEDSEEVPVYTLSVALSFQHFWG